MNKTLTREQIEAIPAVQDKHRADCYSIDKASEEARDAARLDWLEEQRKSGSVDRGEWICQSKRN